jgi:hypothetical protein
MASLLHLQSYGEYQGKGKCYVRSWWIAWRFLFSEIIFDITDTGGEVALWNLEF